MWNHIINIHPSQLLSTKTKECRINESYKKKKVLHNNFFKKMDNLHFILNNILTNYFKKLTKYKNDYQQYLNYINKNYIMHLNVYLYIYSCICMGLQVSLV